MEPKGEIGHESDRTQVTRKEKEKLKEDEMEVEVETKNSKRKVIRVESEETQDYVCGMRAIGQEEAEELAFVPSALSDPRGSIYFCDNRCSEKAVRCWQFASVVVEEGGEAHTVNLCQQCCNEQMVQQGKPRLNSRQWRAVVENKAHRGRIMKIMGGEHIVDGMWEYFTLKKGRGKRRFWKMRHGMR